MIRWQKAGSSDSLFENLTVHASSSGMVTRYVRASFITGCKPANTRESGERETQEGESLYRLRSGPKKR